MKMDNKTHIIADC